MASILDRVERNAMAISADVPRAVAHGIEGLQQLKDQVVGPSEWREVTQEMIDRFAELTGDDQWIHTDVERAERESPYGTTIAHGNLTLSLIDGLRRDLNDWSGFTMGVNYGWNRVRFPAPVPVSSRVRCYAQIVELSEVGGGWHQVVTRFTVEVEGVEKPACVADSVGRVLTASS
jgi:acyl dehydratase